MKHIRKVYIDMNRVINDDCFNVFSTLEDNSILLSAKRLKRNFIGIEIDKDYYDIIQHRLNQPFEAKLF